MSPTRTSLRNTSSSLWSVTLLTVTPPTRTGSTWATGVSAPVRPTYTAMSLTRVRASCGGNFQATAQRGERDRVPASGCTAKSSTLITTLSISYGSLARSAASFSWYAMISSTESQRCETD
jgi:hypothetical protein